MQAQSKQNNAHQLSQSAISIQQSTIEVRKKERELELKLKDQDKQISDLKKQLHRSNEINKSVTDRAKDKDQLLQQAIKDREVAEADSFKAIHDMKTLSKEKKRLEKDVEAMTAENAGAQAEAQMQNINWKRRYEQLRDKTQQFQQVAQMMAHQQQRLIEGSERTHDLLYQ